MPAPHPHRVVSPATHPCIPVGPGLRVLFCLFLSLIATAAGAVPKIGAHFFFWYNCPNGNCNVSQMPYDPPGQTSAYNGTFYSSVSEPWYEWQLNDAKAAGLDYLFPVSWGEKYQSAYFKQSVLSLLATAITNTASTIKIGLYDDTSSEACEWNADNGRGYTNSETDTTKQLSLADPNAVYYFYDEKIKPFFQMFPQSMWATHNGLPVSQGGRPIILTFTNRFYKDLTSAHTMWATIKSRFLADFGVSPWFMPDITWWSSDNMTGVGDGECVYGAAGTAGTLTYTIGSYSCSNLGPGRDDRLIPGRTLYQPRWTNGDSTDDQLDDQWLRDNFRKVPSTASLVLLESWNELWEGSALSRTTNYPRRTGGTVASTFYMEKTKSLIQEYRAGVRYGMVNGTVKDSLGTGVTDAVVATSTGGYSATTASDGFYSLLIPGGTYSLTATKTGFGTSSPISATAVSNAIATKNITLPADTTPPSPVTVTDDGVYTSSTTQLHFTWTPATDTESGVTSYEYAIGTTSGGTNTRAFTNVGNVTEFTAAGLTLTQGQIYYISVRAKNGVGLSGTAGNSNGITIDTTPPSNVTVTDDGQYQPSSTSLHASWTTASDAESGISQYTYAIGTAPGGTDVLGFTSNGPLTSVTRTGLSLAQGQLYYFTVMARNNAGIINSGASSNGITVDATGPVINSVTAEPPDALSAESVTVTANVTDSVSGMSGGNSGVTINGGAATNAGGNWSRTLSSGAVGPHTITVVATDQANNSTSDSSHSYAIWARSVGTSERQAYDSIMNSARGNFLFTLTGKISGLTGSGFDLSDGFPQIVHVSVNTAGLGLANGNYAAARGKLDVSTSPIGLSSSPSTVRKYP